MKQNPASEVLPPSPLPPDARRLVVYALTEVRTTIPRHALRSLELLRPHAERLVVLVTGTVSTDALASLAAVADDLVVYSEAPFDRALYSAVLERDGNSPGGFDEVLLTGDGWYPADTGFSDVFARMRDQAVHAWELIEDREGAPRSFPDQGFPARPEPLTWLAVRGPFPVGVDAWQGAVSADVAAGRRLADRGYSVGAAYPADDFGNANPALYSADRLMWAGCPVLARAPFSLYPPFLQQHAVIGRELLVIARENRFDVDDILSDLSRRVPSKALNTNLGLLEIPAGRDGTTPRPWRIAVLAHIVDLDAADDLINRLNALPPGADLIVTTSDGSRAGRIRRLLEASERRHFRTVGVRVTPANRGRDMSDLFIACRDVLLSDDYDLVLKVQARPMHRKTGIVRHYARRYQWDNLLDSERHVAQILEMFGREPGLGLVFPPMMHIGYQTMGKAWAGFRPAAQRLADRLGIGVPLDLVSPLAPFGRMWIARPAALRLLAEQEWTYRDYGRPGQQEYHDLARLQERMVVSAAAERGFHTRTVLTSEHAEISHTALDFKVDQLFSTTRGYPVDQITLVQRAGRTGYGGIVGLSRMYLRLNHPHSAKIVLPALDVVEWAYRFVRGTFGSDPRFTRTRTTHAEDER
ncbi:MAG: hypothetical protein K0S37_1500 [Microbacterium sp.]|nr:hypothetical protein [Microbacterium sp.]